MARLRSTGQVACLMRPWCAYCRTMQENLSHKPSAREVFANSTSFSWLQMSVTGGDVCSCLSFATWCGGDDDGEGANGAMVNMMLRVLVSAGDHIN